MNSPYPGKSTKFGAVKIENIFSDSSDSSPDHNNHDDNDGGDSWSWPSSVVNPKPSPYEEYKLQLPTTIGGSPKHAQKCPSFLNVNGDTGLHPAAHHDFDYNVVKRLDSMFDDTVSDIFEEEKLKTFLRIRPSSTKTDDGKAKNVRNKKEKVIDVKDETTVVAYPHQKNIFGRDNRKKTEFKFTKVFGPDTGQFSVFQECVDPVIEKFLKGENCLFFTYGATNSGKTYTLQGHGTDYGIIPRALDAIFTQVRGHIFRSMEFKPFLYQSTRVASRTDLEVISQKKERLLAGATSNRRGKSDDAPEASFAGSYSSHSSRSTSVDLVGGGLCDEINYALYANSMLYSIWVSFAEIYNEKVYDLLETDHIRTKKRRKELKLLQDRDGYVYIRDLTEIPVASEEEAYKIFQAGRKNLQFAATQMNQNSSRSHSFFTLRVVTIGVGDGCVPYTKGVHRMTFCDLAGMERVGQTENEGMRLKESGTINASLTVLLKVIRILREKQRSGNMMLETIPFRESKLTHIFKSFFTSSTHIRMIVNVNPDPLMAESTLHVLHNSAIASNVITFRAMEAVEQRPVLKPVQKVLENKGNQDTALNRVQGDQAGKSKVRFKDLDSTTSVSASEEEEEKFKSSNSSTNSDTPPTVQPSSKALLQRIRELEEDKAILQKENSELKKEVRRLKFEKDRMREESANLFADQNRLWRDRYVDLQVKEEHLSERRVSLMRRRIAISPGSKCGRDYTPPVHHLDEVAEEDDRDKENRPPPRDTSM